MSKNTSVIVAFCDASTAHQSLDACGSIHKRKTPLNSFERPSTQQSSLQLIIRGLLSFFGSVVNCQDDVALELISQWRTMKAGKWGREDFCDGRGVARFYIVPGGQLRDFDTCAGSRSSHQHSIAEEDA